MRFSSTSLTGSTGTWNRSSMTADRSSERAHRRGESSSSAARLACKSPRAPPFLVRLKGNAIAVCQLGRRPCVHPAILRNIREEALEYHCRPTHPKYAT
jgi:hypothetical protein